MKYLNFRSCKIRVINILIFIFLGLSNCTNKKEEVSELNDNTNIESKKSFIKSNLVYKGNVVSLGNNENQEMNVQEIVQKREDVIFRIIRVDTEQYLHNRGLKQNEIESALLELKGEQLFFVEFEEIMKQDIMKKYFANNMDQSISYLAFNIQNDFKIINSNNDTLIAEYSILERNYHIAPFERILLNFNGINSTEELELIYSDKLFNKGTMHFYFPKENDIINYRQSIL